MGRNAGLLVLLLVVLGGLFAWLLSDPGAHASAGPGGTGAEEQLATERLGPSAPDAAADADPTEDTGVREAIELDPLDGPSGPLAGLLPLDRTRVVGRLLDPAGEPLGGRTVSLAVVDGRIADLVQAERRGLLRAELEATTDGDGRFAFAPSAATGAWHHLRAEHPSWPPLALGPVGPVPGRDTDVGDLRFGRAATLPLRVIDGEGLALADAEVLLARLAAGGTPIGQPVARTAADGTCLVPGLAPGRYAVGARTPRHALIWSDTIEVDHDQPPAEVTLTLRPGHDLLGRVVDAETNEGVAGAEVLIADRNQRPNVYEDLTSDDQGRFLRPGSYPGQRQRYAVRAPGYLPAWGTLSEEGETAGQLEQVIRLRRQGTVSVRVLDDATDAPIADARLYLLLTESSKTSTAERLGFLAPPGGNPADAPDLARTDAEGLAQVPVPANDRRLQVAADGYLDAAVDLPRDRGEVGTTPLEVRLQRGGGIFVELSGPDGPLAGAAVELCLVTTDASEGEGNDNGRRNWRRERGVSANELVWSDLARLLPVARRASDAGGQARFTPVPRGFFRVVASAPGLGRAVSEPLRLREGDEQLELALELLPAGRIDGRVLLRGEPAPGQRVLALRELRAASGGSALPAEAEVHATRADDQGRFEFEGLGPGTWQLTALLPGDVSGAAANGRSAVTRQVEKKSLPVDLVAGDRRSVELEAQSPGAILTGRVQLNHQPRGGLQVSARMRDPDGGRGPRLSTETDSAGRYRLEGLLEGDWDLEVETDSARSNVLYAESVPLAELLVRVGDVEALERDVSVEVGALTLRVTAPELSPDAQGQPRKVRWVSLQLTADQARGGIVGIDGGGRIRGWFPVDTDTEFPEVPVGAYRAQITESNVKPVSQPIDIDAGLGTRLEVTLEAKDEE